MLLHVKPFTLEISATTGPFEIVSVPCIYMHMCVYSRANFRKSLYTEHRKCGIIQWSTTDIIAVRPKLDFSPLELKTINLCCLSH